MYRSIYNVHSNGKIKLIVLFFKYVGFYRKITIIV